MQAAADHSSKRVSGISVALISNLRDHDEGDKFGLENGFETGTNNSAATFHMTDSKEFMSDTRPSDDQVRIGDYKLIDVECVGTVTVVFPSEKGDVTLRIKGVAYVPNLRYNFFSLVAAHQTR